jgi:lipid II:glycine glycyltransferase (peptidoglycan interpeptide bridge formation enzyme)
MEVDLITKEDWHRALKEFRDANYFQTWEYGSVAWGEQNVSHAVLRQDGRIRAAAQVRITNILPGVKHAYVVDGPLWRTNDGPDDQDLFEAMIRGLLDEYAKKRGCTLRLYPFVHDHDAAAESISACLERNGFVNAPDRPRTLFLDITAPSEELKRNMRKQWRQCLRYAEEGGLDVTVGTDRELFLACLDAYRGLHERKGFTENVRMEDFLAVHELLPEQDKMTIVAVGKDKRVDACMISTALGDTGIPVLAATARTGLKNYASYLAYWEMLKQMSEKGVRWFDFRGIDPEGNRGVYNFKKGISGSRGIEVSFLGDFVRYHDGLSRAAIMAAKRGLSAVHSVASLLRGSARRPVASALQQHRPAGPQTVRL